MLKKDLVDKIASTGLTKRQAGDALDAVLEAISGSLKDLSLIHISEPTRPY
jgi:nucleoid DNA-binding protein